VNLEEMLDVLDCVSFPGYEFSVTMDGRGAIYLQAAYREADTQTMQAERQLTRRWFMSPEMTRSEIVSTAFKCIITSQEHRTREWFKYRGNAIFMPHFDVDALWELCAKTAPDARAVTVKA
jgi:hypothetical protein